MDRVIDAPIYPRPFAVTELDYQCADAAEEFISTREERELNPVSEERRDSSALGFALSRELAAMRELVK